MHFTKDMQTEKRLEITAAHTPGRWHAATVIRSTHLFRRLQIASSVAAADRRLMNPTTSSRTSPTYCKVLRQGVFLNGLSNFTIIWIHK
jgi:hypothetical protein